MGLPSTIYNSAFHLFFWKIPDRGACRSELGVPKATCSLNRAGKIESRRVLRGQCRLAGDGRCGVGRMPPRLADGTRLGP
jgi:hypothetical protein